MNRPLCFLLLATALSLLTACANQPPQADLPGAYRNAEALSQWQLKGKVGITTPADRVNATIGWQQNEHRFAIDLSGPFGQGRTAIEGDDQSITVTTGNQTVSGQSAQDLMQQQLGWSVPVMHFAYWARGVPSPLTEVTSIEYDADGALSYLIQDGWQVDLSRYQSVSGWSLPARLSAKTTNIALVMVVKEWQLP